MFGPRDRFFAELVVVRGLASAEAVRALALRLSDQEPGTFSIALEKEGIITSGVREALEREADRLRHDCVCGEVYYLRERNANACPRCRRAPTPRASLTEVDATPRPPVIVPRSTTPAPSPAPPPTSPLPSPAPSPDPTSFGAPPPPRRRFGPYVVLEELGRGGMGVVYKARQEPIGRIVALKALLEVKGKRRERFFREARAAAKISHPNVVRVHDVGEEDGVLYYSMDLVKGRPLDVRLIAQGPMELGEALELHEGLSRAVQAVHDAGLLHRDLKPGNVILREDGSPLLIDFGLARALEDDGERLTKTGVAVGTPHYMSPEQIRGIRGEIDHRTDVWALGVILFELLAGERPFKGETTADLYLAIQTTDAPRLRSVAKDAPESVESIVAKALEREKEQRYSSAGALADEVARVRSGLSAEANAPAARKQRARRRLERALRRIGPGVLAAAFVLAAGGVAGGLWWRSEREAQARKAGAERETVRKRAATALAKVKLLADESSRENDPARAHALADEACAAAEGLGAELGQGVLTDGGKAEVARQLASPEARSARRAALASRGRAARRRGDARELLAAERDLAQAREGAPDDPELATLHAGLLLALGRAGEAQKALAPALAGALPEPDVVRLAAEARLECGDTAGALARIEPLLASRPGDTAARLVRARVRLRSGELAGALDDARAAARELDPRAAKGRDEAPWLEARALAVEALLAQGQLDEAWTEASETAKAKPDEPVAVLALARVLGARGDDDQAARVLGRVLAKHADDPRLLAARADAECVLLDDRAARADLEAAIERAPSARRATELAVALARLADAAQDPERAVLDLARAEKEAGGDPGARALVHAARARRALLVSHSPTVAAEELALAEKEGEPVPGTAAVQALAALARKDGAAALEAAARARAEDALDPFAVSLEIEARRLRGDQDAAPQLGVELARLEERAQDAAARLARRAANLARTALLVPDARRAAPVWDSSAKRALRSVSLGPGRPGALAWASAAVGRTAEGAAEARRLLARAVELGQDSFAAQLWDGRAHLSAKENESAARELGRALTLGASAVAEDASFWHDLAVARALVQDFPGAREAATKLLVLDPDSQDGLAVLADAARARGDETEAASWRKKHAAAREAPQKAQALAQEGLRLLHQRPSESVARFESALALTPRWALLWRELTFAQQGAGDQMASFHSFTRSVELEPYMDDGGDPEEHFFLQARKVLMVADTQSFIAENTDQLATEPRAAHRHFLVAFSEWVRVAIKGEASEGWLDRAISHLDQAVALDPRFSLAYAYRGHLRRQRGEIGPAREDLDRATVLGGSRMPLAHVFRAGLEASLGENDAAERELGQALEQGFGDRSRILADPALSKLAGERPKTVGARIEKMPEQPSAQGFGEGF